MQEVTLNSSIAKTVDFIMVAIVYVGAMRVVLVIVATEEEEVMLVIVDKQEWAVEHRKHLGYITMKDGVSLIPPSVFELNSEGWITWTKLVLSLVAVTSCITIWTKCLKIMKNEILTELLASPVFDSTKNMICIPVAVEWKLDANGCSSFLAAF